MCAEGSVVCVICSLGRKMISHYILFRRLTVVLLLFILLFRCTMHFSYLQFLPSCSLNKVHTTNSLSYKPFYDTSISADFPLFS